MPPSARKCAHLNANPTVVLMNVVMKFVMPPVMKYYSDASLILVSERIPADDLGAPTLAVPECDFQSPRRKNLWKTKQAGSASRGRNLLCRAKLLFK
jgi:hypothetical protein